MDKVIFLIGYIIIKDKENFFKKFINKIEIEEFKNGKKYCISKVNNKLIKKLKNDKIDNVVISKKDKENDILINQLKENNIKILENRNLFKNLIPEIIEYLAKILDINKENMEINILVNKYSRINLYYINNLIKVTKKINIITKNMKTFKKFSDKLYENEAILIPIMNNKSKSLANKEIILNIDFSEKDLKQYRINRYAIIINIENNIKSINKTFSGILINDYRINIESDNKEFDYKEILASYILKENVTWIREKIAEKDIKIGNLIGKNGIINSEEFRSVKCKKNKLDKQKILT